MSREPSSALELTRRSFEAADSGDYDWMLSFYGPESVFDMAPWGLGTYEGLTAIRAFFEDWIGAFDEFEMKLEEVVDLGDGVVFAVARQSARSAGSRDPLVLRHAAVSLWGDGVLARVTNYADLEQGRAVAEELAAEVRARRQGAAEADRVRGSEPGKPGEAQTLSRLTR